MLMRAATVVQVLQDFFMFYCMFYIYTVPDRSGDGVLFSIDFFVCFFVSLLAILRENGWTDMREILMEGAE